MKKKIYILFCSIYFISHFAAQSLIPLNERGYIDSLKNTLKGNKPEFKKINSLFLLSEVYRNSDSNSASRYLSKIKINTFKSPLLKAKYYYYQGIYYYNLDKKKSENCFKKAIEGFSKFNSASANYFQAESWYHYSLAQTYGVGFYSIVQTIFEKSLPLVQKHHDQKRIAHFYTLIGQYLSFNFEFDKSEKYLLKSQKILENTPRSSTEKFNNYIALSNLYCYIPNESKVQLNINKAKLLISNYHNSSYYPLYLYSLAMLYLVKKQNEKALQQLDLGINLSRKYGQYTLEQKMMFQKIEIFIKLKKYNIAKKIMKELLYENSIVKEPNNRKAVYQRMMITSELQGKYYEALGWAKMYTALSDSINTKNLHYKISALETKYRTAEKDVEIIKNQIRINKMDMYMWILGFSSLLLLLMIVFFYFYYKNKRRLSMEREINLQQKILEKVQAEELKLIKATLDGEEQERERIAKDLHDGVGGLFAVVKLNLSNWGTTNIKQSQKDFKKILSQLDYSISELRRVAENIVPVSLTDYGLINSINDLCAFFSSSEIKIQFLQLHVNESLISRDFQLNIYRIIQELLANAVKHSKADNVFVQCSQFENVFLITVEDNGQGLDIESQNKGNGFLNIMKRISYMKGRIDIKSKMNSGTSINIEININGK